MVGREALILDRALGVARLALLGAVLGGIACGRSSQDSGRHPGPARRVITAEQIAKTGAKSCWDAVRFTVRSISTRETADGRPLRIERRGNSSVYLDDQVQVFMDGLRIFEFQVLDNTPASDIARIEVLTGLDATTRYGTNAADGVILIYTRLADEADAGES
jgi:outer membrane receptor protein involved in Fe transport